MAVEMVFQLIDQMRQGQLLTPPQLDELKRSLQRRFLESNALAHALVKRGWLTAYQTEQLLHGGGAGLVLGPYMPK